MKTIKSSLIICLCVFSICLFIAGLSNSVQAITITDDFNDGNTDGWSSATILPDHELGNWRVETQQLVQDKPGDGMLFYPTQTTLSNQSVEVKLYPYYGAGNGFIIWHHDQNNLVLVCLAPSGVWPEGDLVVAEIINGVTNSYYFDIKVPTEAWYTLRADANSLTGEFAIYLNDTYLGTKTLVTPNRTGLTGLATGNAGGKFDDFRLTSDHPNVTIDIMPGVFPNTINLSAKGTVPVAILSTPNFDASQVDPTTVSFAGATVASKGKKGDVTLMVSMVDVNADELSDMMLYFDTQALQLTQSSTEAFLSGKTSDGMDIMGKDTVSIVSKGKH